MLKLELYFLYISLYAGLNIAIGIIIIFGFAYNPIIDFYHFADLFTGFVVFTIGALCFTGLKMRHDNSPRALKTRRRIGYLLIKLLIPVLIVCLVVNLIITPSASLLVASVLSFLAAGLTFVLIQHRLHSPLFRVKKKR